MTDHTPITVRLPAALRERLRVAAQRSGLSVSGVVRDALVRWLDDPDGTGLDGTGDMEEDAEVWVLASRLSAAMRVSGMSVDDALAFCRALAVRDRSAEDRP